MTRIGNSENRRYRITGSRNRCECLFFDLRSAWQRGSNENTNDLLRQYFPKYIDLKVHFQSKFHAVAQQLNKVHVIIEAPTERCNASF